MSFDKETCVEGKASRRGKVDKSRHVKRMRSIAVKPRKSFKKYCKIKSVPDGAEQQGKSTVGM